ncbi:laccase [Intrasporangium oryzae NRRL B-24470]|uniref:Purine nucleoside phosphorylase n=1 Tax=Intrasporangium oryzae NRRL B-24470 TaxID=1386089 RepID=W9G7D9_9MICO|nr:peptidoglycan editing factor PgeF [Intrasporangium oryzae]EWS99793.1 laccase [Intrasporangium oryzae NRRL B-24470]
MFYWRSTVPAAAGDSRVDVAFTGRSAGLGDGPYAGLNLGGHVGDDPGDVERNRALLANAVGVPRTRLVFMNQVHGTTVLPVSGPWSDRAPAADGIVTRTPELALAVLVADCVPVLLHDPHAGVVGAVHAGRPGMTNGIVAQAVARMRELGAERISATVGPSVCGRCYEVPEDMARGAASVAPASAARSWTGTHAVDVAAGVVEQLRTADVAIDWVPGCTREHPDLYSYRRDRTTGRFAGVVIIRKAAE